MILIRGRQQLKGLSVACVRVLVLWMRCLRCVSLTAWWSAQWVTLSVVRIVVCRLLLMFLMSILIMFDVGGRLMVVRCDLVVACLLVEVLGLLVRVRLVVISSMVSNGKAV